MKVFSAPASLQHDPGLELHNGAFVPHAECQNRLTSIQAALNTSQPAVDHGMDPILAVHDKDYVAFLQRAYEDWHSAGRPGNAIPYVFPIRGRRPLTLSRIDAELGRYSFDCGTPIAEHTWQAAYGSVQSALSALADVMDNKSQAFAICRPPGHHSGADYFGGYCYLNNAAIGAQAALTKGATRVAILDVDYHHGNGTQDIFYERGDVLTISIHADPKTDYPFYWGHADETGAGQGSGKNLNLPLPRGTGWKDYAPVLDQALNVVQRFDPELLIVPFGADTFDGDPISHFTINTEEFARISSAIRRLNLPTLITMEGGYAVENLGSNVASFLGGFSA